MWPMMLHEYWGAYYIEERRADVSNICETLHTRLEAAQSRLGAHVCADIAYLFTLELTIAARVPPLGLAPLEMRSMLPNCKLYVEYVRGHPKTHCG